MRRSRAAIVGATIATSTSLIGCYDDHGRRTDTGVVAPDAASQPDTGAVISAYGTPFPDDAFDHDAGAPAAEYGGPPLMEDDAGVSPDADMGDPGADYGGPPSD